MNTPRYVIVATLTTLVAACGGGTGGTGATGGGSSTAVSIGIMQKGSIILNGVNFNDNTANVRIDGVAGTSAQLQSGMYVKLRGEINADGVTGMAQTVSAEAEVRGTVQATNPTAVPPSFTVIGQTVLVDDLTVFANFAPAPASPSAAVGALNPTVDVVEVHGLRDAAGNIHASRVELIAAPGPGTDELHGIVAGLTQTTFTLNGVTVDFSRATVSPNNATLVNGQSVQVHGAFSSGTFSATRVDIEDFEDAPFEHAAGEEFDIEGQVSGCGANNPCTMFLVGTQAVQTNANTQFENGTAADLADNITVEAEGHQFTVAGTLIAEKIEFERPRIILTGVAMVTGSIPGTGTLRVFGKPIQITSLTVFNLHSATISSNERIEVRGFVDSMGNVVAEEIDDNPGGNSTRSILQAQVTAEQGNLLTLLGVNADVSNPNAIFQDTNELPITRDMFLAGVTPATTGGTLVKVQGTFDPGTNTIAVEEAELEN